MALTSVDVIVWTLGCRLDYLLRVSLEVLLIFVDAASDAICLVGKEAVQGWMSRSGSLVAANTRWCHMNARVSIGDR